MILRRLALMTILTSSITAVAPALSPTAMAQNVAVFSDEGLLEMLPAGQIIGDGHTQVKLFVTAIASNGAPLDTSRLRIEATSGETTDLNNRGDGLIEFMFTPDSVTAEQEVLIRLQGRGPDGMRINSAWSVMVTPPNAATMTSTINPSEVILNQDRSATVSFSLSGVHLNGASPSLVVRSSSGDVSNITHLGAGQFTALYTPPAVSYPHAAIITVADERSPSETYNSLSVPLVGKTDFPLENQVPNATIIMEIDGRRFGPYQTDSSGQTSIPVIVPPGVNSAIIHTIVNSDATQATIPLQVPATRRIAMFPTNSGIPSDGIQSVTLRAAVITATGAPDPNAAVRFSASTGTIGEAVHEGNGVYAAIFSTTTSNNSGQVELAVSIDGEGGVQNDSIVVPLIRSRPASLTLQSDPPTLSETAQGFKLFAKVEGTDGTGLSGRSITFFANGARVTDAVRDLGNGDYEASFTAIGDQAVEVSGTAMPTATGNPLAGLVVFSSKSRLRSDGLSSALITIVSVDAFGYPVPSQPINLSVIGGGGSLPDSVTTDPQGLAQIFYTSGNQPGIAHISAESNGAVGGTALLQAPDSVLPDFRLPLSGNENTRFWNQAWQGIVATAAIPREGVDSVVDVATAIAPGTIMGLQVSAQPEATAPGGTVSLTIGTRDTTGRGVTGQTFDVMASQGSVSSLQDNGDGTYTTTLSIPSEARDNTRVVISTEDGSVFQMLHIRTVDGAAWQTEVESQEETDQGSTEPTEEEIAAAMMLATLPPIETAVETAQAAATQEAKGEMIRVRFGSFYGQYNYTQTSEAGATSNPLYTGEVKLPGASYIGGEIQASMWVPTQTWLGVEVDVSVGSYAAGWPLPSGDTLDIPDVVPSVSTSLVARYQLEAQSNFNLYFAGKIGFMYSDFVTYTWKPNTDRTVVEYGPLSVSGASLGASLGGDTNLMGTEVFFSATINEGLIGGQHLSTGIDVELGADVIDGIFVSGIFAITSRDVTIVDGVSGENFGTVSDSSWTLGVGAGSTF